MFLNCVNIETCSNIFILCLTSLKTKKFVLFGVFFKRANVVQKATIIRACSKHRPSYLLQGADSCSAHQFLCPCSFLVAEGKKNLNLKARAEEK